MVTEFFCLTHAGPTELTSEKFRPSESQGDNHTSYNYETSTRCCGREKVQEERLRKTSEREEWRKRKDRLCIRKEGANTFINTTPMSRHSVMVSNIITGCENIVAAFAMPMSHHRVELQLFVFSFTTDGGCVTLAL